MITYGLGILPVIQDFRADHPRVTQPWYTDESGTGNNFAVIRRHLDDLVVQVPSWGYFPEPIKRILVVSLQNVPRAEAFIRGYILQVVTGRWYLGGFFRTKEAQDRWL